MFRFLLATVFVSSALYATPVAFTSCTAGATTISPCGGDINFPGGITGPNYSVTAFADASDNSLVPGVILSSEFPTIQGRTLSTVAEALAEGSSPPTVPPLSAIAHGSAGGTFYTSGPSRPGFIQFNVQVDRLHGGEASALLTDGTHQYGYNTLGEGSTSPLFCGIEDCGWTATVPFRLGLAFQVSALSDVTESSGHGGADSIVVFRLLEADGTTPVPFTSTPEPASWGLLLFGLMAGWLSFSKRPQVR